MAGAVVLVVFAVWCTTTVLAVARLRGDLNERVAWLAEVHGAKAAVVESRSAGPARAAAEGLAMRAEALAEARGSDDPLATRLADASRDIREIADARDDGGSRVEDEHAVLAPLDETVAMIREETAAITTALTGRWQAMYAIAGVAVLLAFSMLILLAYLRLVVLPRVESDSERLHRLAHRLAKSELAAHGVAGELNNPLTAVVTNLQLLAERLRGPSRGMPIAAASDIHLIEDALQGIARVSGTVQDLRSTGSGPALPAAFDVNAIVDGVLQAVRFRAADAVRVSLALERLPEVHAPEGLVRDVVEDVVMAGLVSEDGAREGLTLRTSTAGSKSIALEIEAPAGALTGLDVAAFERRLAIVGGRFAATTVDARVQFRLELPTVPMPATSPAKLQPVSAATQPPAAGTLTTDARRVRILLVDDDELVRTSVKRVLARQDVTTEGDGETAIARILGEDYDLVLCDLMMPGKSGMDVFHEVVAVRPDLARRFVFISGGASTAEAEHFLEQHAPARLDKPFGTDALRKLVAEAASRQKP